MRTGTLREYSWADILELIYKDAGVSSENTEIQPAHGVVIPQKKDDKILTVVNWKKDEPEKKSVEATYSIFTYNRDMVWEPAVVYCYPTLEEARAVAKSLSRRYPLKEYMVRDNLTHRVCSAYGREGIQVDEEFYNMYACNIAGGDWKHVGSFDGYDAVRQALEKAYFEDSAHAFRVYDKHRKIKMSCRVGLLPVDKRR